MPHTVGDTPTIDLTVAPCGPDTLAAATARTPTGAAVALTVLPGDDPSQWSTRVPLTEPGEWVIAWTVTGTGAATEAVTLLVAPAPGGPAGRVYATTGQLAAYLDDAPPPSARRLLRRASQKVDELLLTSTYRVDADGMPVDAPVADALAEATCAQVAWWGEIGDDTGTGAVAALAGTQIGDVKLAASASGGASTRSTEYAPAAISALRRANLTGRGPIVYDRLSGGLLGQPGPPL